MYVACRRVGGESSRVSTEKKHDNEGQWIPLHEGTILPGYVYDREWERLGVSEERKEDVFTVIDRVTSDGENLLELEDGVTRLQEFGGVPAGTLIAMNRNFNEALAAGFGFIDETENNPLEYEYGLFAVYEDKPPSADPVAVYSPRQQENAKEELIRDLRVESYGDGVAVTWEVKESNIYTVGIIGFHVYVRADEKEDFSRITQTTTWRDPSPDGLMRLKVPHDPDDESMKDASREYAVEPVTAFQEYLERTTIIYTPAPNVLPPHRLDLRRGEEVLYELSWKIPDENELPTNGGLAVERALTTKKEAEMVWLGRDLKDEKFERLTDDLSLNDRKWVDPLRVDKKTFVVYRVVILDHDRDAEYASSQRMEILAPNPPPSAPNL